MLNWLYDLMMTIVSFVLGLFGLNTKKHVHFEDEDEKPTENALNTEQTPVADVVAVEESNE